MTGIRGKTFKHFIETNLHILWLELNAIINTHPSTYLVSFSDRMTGYLLGSVALPYSQTMYHCSLPNAEQSLYSSSLCAMLLRPQISTPS